MTPSIQAPEGKGADEKPTGIVTNGIGERTTAHLNLTIPLPTIKRSPPTFLPAPGRQPYAGFDETDKGWR